MTVYGLGVVSTPAMGAATWSTIERISQASGGGNTDGNSGEPSVSWNGRFVAFSSLSSNLVTGDTNSKRDIFVKDRQIGTTVRVSVDSSGTQANDHSRQPAISGNGRYVAFTSAASNLVPGDTNGVEDVFVKDMQTNITERVSVNSAGDEAIFASGSPKISYDGRYVVFASFANNLAPGDTNGTWDVFVRDRQAGVTKRVSVRPDEVQANGASENPALSFDARYVAFESSATNLDPADTSSFKDIYLKDLLSDTITRVSVPQNPAVSTDNHSYAPTVSADGSRVSFTSFASNLVAGDLPDTSDVFVRDMSAGVTTRVGLSWRGDPVESVAAKDSMSYDGKRVTFHSSSAVVVPGDNNIFADVFVRDTAASSTAIVSSRSGEQLNDNATNPVISGDGRYVAYETAGTFTSAWPDSDGNLDVYFGYSSETPLTPEPSPNALGNFVPGPPPPPPSNLRKVSVGDTTAGVAWDDNSSDEFLFKIERKIAGGSYAEVARVGANVTSFADSGLVPGAQYVYRVRAANTEANSAYSNEITLTTTGGFPPASPTGLTASALGPSSVRLDWIDNAANEDSYRIERRQTSGIFEEITVIGADITSFTDTALIPLTTYTYRVRASNSAGFSSYSNEATVTTPSPAAPEPPTSLTISRVGATALELTWTDMSSSESGFRVERSLDGISYTVVGTVGSNATRFEDSLLEGSTKYFYRAVAFNLGGDSPPSNVVSTTTRPSAVCRLDSVVYTSDASGNSEIYLRQGGSTKRVTFSGVNEKDPVIDPDGTLIWYTSNESGFDKLYTINVDGQGKRIRSPDPAGSFSDRSPALGRELGGRTKVAFISDRSGSPEVYVMNADGSSLSRLTNFGVGDRTSPTFTPDSSAIVFSSSHTGTLRLYTVAVVGGPVAELFPGGTDNRADPSLSPDGSKIVYVSDKSGSSAQVYLRDIATGVEVVLTSSRLFYKARPRFSADGSLVYFVAADVSTGLDIRAVPVAGGSETTLVGTTASEILGGTGVAAPYDYAPLSSYLAEGATAGGFETWLLLANPTNASGSACITLLTDGGPVRAGVFSVGPKSRLSLNLGTFVRTYFAGSVVESLEGKVLAERAMYSGVPGKLGSHLSKGAPEPSTIWHAAEGATAGEFETWILIANPSFRVATVDVAFLSTGGVVGTSRVPVPPGRRVSVLADSVVPSSFDVATKVTSDVPVVVERATYTSGPTRSGATASPALPAQGTSWFVAEGATIGGFETWILVSNQGSQPACVTVTLLELWGAHDVYGPSTPLCLAPLSRRSLNLGAFTSTFEVATKVTSVAGSDGSIVATAARPVVVERAMYNNHPVLGKGSSSAEAVQEGGTEWLTVEGATSGGFETWVLLANPGPQAACADVVYLTSTGAVPDPRATPICLLPGTRRSLRINDVVVSYDVATYVKSVSGSAGGITAISPQPIVVERSIYTPAMPIRDANSGPGFRLA
ncbi:MAG: hypothetical protein C4319_01570 [Acidimicrobiia bacterium]